MENAKKGRVSNLNRGFFRNGGTQSVETDKWHGKQVETVEITQCRHTSTTIESFSDR